MNYQKIKKVLLGRSKTRDVDTSDSITILINGSRKIFYAPVDHPRDPGGTNNKIALDWVFGYRYG